MRRRYTICLKKDNDTGQFVAKSPYWDVESSGKTKEEALSNLKEAIQLRVKTYLDEHGEIPMEGKIHFTVDGITFTQLEVEI